MHIQNEQGKTPWRVCALCVFWLLVGVYWAAFGLNCLKYTGRHSPDSVIYINAAEVFLETGRVSHSFYELHEAMKLDRVPPIPMTVWNPLYPVLIAACSLAMTPAAAALAVSVLGQGIFLTAAFLLVRRLAGSGAALLGTAALLHFTPLALVAVRAWSETTALACLAACLLLLPGARPPGGRTAAFAAGIMGGLAFLARLALVPVAPVGVLVMMRRGHPRESLRNAALFSGAFLLLAGPVLVRRHLNVPPPVAPGGLLQVVSDTAGAVWSGLIPEDWFVRLFYALLCVVFLALFLRRLRSGDGAIGKTLPRRSLLLPLWVMAYLAFLVYTCSRMYIDSVGARLALPATFALLLFLVILFHALARPPFWLCAVAALLLAGHAAVSEARTSRSVLPANIAPAHEFALRRDNWESMQWLHEHAGPEDLIIAEDGLDLPLFLGPVKVLYFLGNDERVVSQEAFWGYLDRHRGEYRRVFLVIKPAKQPGETGAGRDPSGMRRIAAGLEAAARLKDGEVFELRGEEPGR